MVSEVRFSALPVDSVELGLELFTALDQVFRHVPDQGFEPRPSAPEAGVLPIGPIGNIQLSR
jgi:hypothetical protein